MNLYTFAHDDPVNGQDPSGLCGWCSLGRWIWGRFHPRPDPHHPPHLRPPAMPVGQSSGNMAALLGVGQLLTPAKPVLEAMGTVVTQGPLLLMGGMEAAAVEVVAARPFAMGLSDGLDAFADARGASTWKDLADPLNWKSGVLHKLADPNTLVHFNLDGVDVWAGVTRAAAGDGGATDWELMQIRQNPQWWDSLHFWADGSPAPNPFLR